MEETRNNSAEVTFASLKIGDLARRAGKSPRALRLYEDIGLLGPSVRTEGGHRLYAQEAVVRLQWIERLQLLGLSLPDIRAFLESLDNADRGPEAMRRVRGLFEEKLGQLRQQIQSLRSLESELREGLTYLETCAGCASEHPVEACRECGEHHSTPEPVLISGIHPRSPRLTQLLNQPPNPSVRKENT